MLNDLILGLLPKLLFKFKVEKIDKDRGVLLRSLFGWFFTYHEDLSNKKLKIQHDMIKTHKKLLKLYSDYLDADQQQKEMLDLVKYSSIETKYRSPLFMLEDSIFPFRHPTVQSPNKDDWEKVENIVKGTLPKTHLQKQLDYIKEVEKNRNKSVSLKDDRVFSSVSESETISMDDIANSNQISGGSNNNQSKQKNNQQQQNNNRQRGYYEPQN